MSFTNSDQLKMTLRRASFIYIRHGQTDWNLQNRAMGQKDIPLNQTGVAQALKAREHLKNCPIDTICYSPLLRAKTTAEILNEQLQCLMICIEDLKEAYWGELEGQEKEHWFPDWKIGKLQKGVEPYHDFLKRALNGINQALSLSSKVLIVAHGGTYFAVQHYAELEHENLPNCIPILHLPPSESHDKWESRLLNT